MLMNLSNRIRPTNTSSIYERLRRKLLCTFLLIVSVGLDFINKKNFIKMPLHYRTRGVNQVKKDMLAMCEDKRFVWARNATVAFARGIQQRLSRPGAYALADG